MRLVADHLREQALARTGTDDFDEFGRSAFNRYYYATFLMIREKFYTMGVLQVGQELPHANVPERLRGTLKKELSKARLKIHRSGDKELTGKIHSAESAAEDLARMIEEAKAIRTLADYEPETAIVLSRRGFSLVDVDIDAAKAWPQKAEGYLRVIESAWRQINV